MSKSRTIFVDADAFIALIRKDDTNHKKAKDIFKQLQDKPVTFVTSSYVFAEVVTILSQRVNHETAVVYIQSMKSEDSVFLIEKVDEAIEEIAIEIFIAQTSKNVSFVDCMNIALIRKRHMDGIFSFDEDYKKNRIVLVVS